VAWSGGDLVAVLSADDGKGVALEEFNVAAGVVVVARSKLVRAMALKARICLLVSIDDVCELDAAIRSFLQVW
jgi:hypothetical protein